MLEQTTICPYTGLRSFTEEESLYFKGRDLQVDQITALLEQNKFLMVTGASGEGKSSLIYAGLIPNARAGFFKAKYTNWVVADFRPERSPVKNMAAALAETFHAQPTTVETELRRGFSSLIDLYTNSDYYIDENDPLWNGSDETVKKDRRRKAANLLIIVDQFEEFFTNPENFFAESPSQDSQVVVNLILETARIAIKKNIPVYMVCTMRSDYIGQCSAFRGLPEYIGFSQFFVPRLKRKDLKQVIEEPAILSGNRISQRLIERLVYDVSEGVDQLPILQHALAQVWMMADHGREEMDLIHYAMVGGMPAEDLPDDELPRFNKWLQTLSANRRKYFRNTGLNRVIEIHASILYENAWDYYNREHGLQPITQKEAKKIIALTFSCLTKIDNSRAVRNRMTLGEITSIINTPGITTTVVADVLRIYREEGNSFLRPFCTNDPATHTIDADTVLDITHESLIRNWDKLNTWASREYDFYTTYLDFKKQMDRWKNSGKGNGFLLPIGPLSYFENWYEQCKPNAGWIRRYAEIKEDSTREAEQVLTDIREFIKRSARKVAISRAFMKYGPQRIAVVLAIAVMLVLTGYYWYDAEQKQPRSVLSRTHSETQKLLKSTEVGLDAKAIPLLMEERYKNGSLLPYLAGLPAKERLSLTAAVYEQLIQFNKKDRSLLKQSLRDSLQKYTNDYMASGEDPSYLLEQVNIFSSNLAYDQYYAPSDTTAKCQAVQADLSYQLALAFFRSKKLFSTSIPYEINYGLQHWLTFGNVSAEKIQRLLSLVSPFDSASKEMFDTYYPKGGYEINGRIPNDYNSGYHTLASLYAALGDDEKVKQCFEVLKQDGQTDYFTGSLFNNYNNILGIFYQFGHRDKAGSVVKWLGENYPTNTPLTIYRNAMIRAGHLSHLYLTNISGGFLRSYKGYFYPNLCLARREVFYGLCDDYEKLIAEVKVPDERNYMLATFRKRKAMYEDKYRFDRGLPENRAGLDTLLSQAVASFRKVSSGYLDTANISVTTTYYTDGVRTKIYKRRELFVYPDYMEGWFSSTYHSDMFFDYIVRNKLAAELYTTPSEIRMINYWVAKAYEKKPFADASAYDNFYPLSDKTLTDIIDLAATHPQGKALDLNLIYLMLANRNFKKGNVPAGLDYFSKFNKNDFSASRDRYEYVEKTFFLNQLKDACVYLALAGKHEMATDLAEKFEELHEKAFAYIAMADHLYRQGADPFTFVCLDSVFSKSRTVDFTKFNYGLNQLDYRFDLILTLSRIGGKALNAYSQTLLSEILQGSKFRGLISRVFGVSEEGNYYRAWSSIPAIVTEQEELFMKSIILWQASRKTESQEQKQQWGSMDDFFYSNFDYIFFNAI